MPIVAALTTLFGQLLCGFLIIPLLLFLLHTDSFPLYLIGDLLILLQSKEGRDYVVSLTPLIIISAYILGVLIDSLGHLMDEFLFDRIWTRESSVSAIMSKEITKLSERFGVNLDLCTALQSTFYNNCSSHMLSYHSEQWSYYEFFRNILIIALFYIGFFVWFYPSWRILTALGTTALIMILIMRWTLTYYYNVESYVVLGWLQSKNLDLLLKDKPSSPEALPTPKTT